MSLAPAMQSGMPAKDPARVIKVALGLSLALLVADVIFRMYGSRVSTPNSEAFTRPKTPADARVVVEVAPKPVIPKGIDPVVPSELPPAISPQSAQLDVAGSDNLLFLPVMDRSGSSVPASVIPQDLRKILQESSAHIISQNVGKPYTLVVGAIAAPAGGAPPLAYSRELVGNNRNGGLDYFRGTTVDDHGFCIQLLDFTAPTTCELRCFGYKTVSIALPTAKAPGNIIWVGTSAFEPTPIADRRVIKGRVVSSSGIPTTTKGQATLRLNGGPVLLTAPIADGRFTFEGISPGKYLVEFLVDGMSIATWFADLPEGQGVIQKDVTVYALQTFSLRIHGGVKDIDVEVTAGIPYHDHNVQLPDGGMLRWDQEGDRMSVYSQKYLVDVTSPVPHTAYAPYFSWQGSLHGGDVVQLLDKDSRKAIYTIDCVRIRSADIPGEK